MKFTKLFYIIVAVSFFMNTNSALSYSIIQKGVEKYGYNEPIYPEFFQLKDPGDKFEMYLIAPAENFPFSSQRQGSVFYKIFEDFFEKEHFSIIINYVKDYNMFVSEFESGRTEAEGLFGVYYDNVKYSKNKYLYPSFAENNIHIITPTGKNINATTKEELKNYKGAYTKEDYLPSFVLKDFAKLGMIEKNSFSEMFEALLTGEVDYIASSYYQSQIKLYKLGLRDYVKYSINPVWSAPIFLKLSPKTAAKSRLDYLKKYLKTNEYKQKRDAALMELLDIYKKNTEGVVPPTYIKTIEDNS